MLLECVAGMMRPDMKKTIDMQLFWSGALNSKAPWMEYVQGNEAINVARG